MSAGAGGSNRPRAGAVSHPGRVGVKPVAAPKRSEGGTGRRLSRSARRSEGHEGCHAEAGRAPARRAGVLMHKDPRRQTAFRLRAACLRGSLCIRPRLQRGATGRVCSRPPLLRGLLRALRAFAHFVTRRRPVAAAPATGEAESPLPPLLCCGCRPYCWSGTTWKICGWPTEVTLSPTCLPSVAV